MNNASRTWLTSFGDLLTLLLCFIVVSVYRSAHDFRVKTQEKQQVSAESLIMQQDPAPSGRLFASKKLTESQHSALLLQAGDLNSLTGELSQAGLAKVQEYAGLSEGRLELGACNAKLEFAGQVLSNLVNLLSTRQIDFTVGEKVCRSLKLIAGAGFENELLLRADHHG